MKILIGYDGPECAAAAGRASSLRRINCFRCLKRAGVVRIKLLPGNKGLRYEDGDSSQGIAGSAEANWGISRDR